MSGSVKKKLTKSGEELLVVVRKIEWKEKENGRALRVLRETPEATAGRYSEMPENRNCTRSTDGDVCAVSPKNPIDAAAVASIARR